MSLFRALNARPYVLFLVRVFILGLGDGLYSIAMAWWITDRTGSAKAMGQILAFSYLPRLVFLLLGGVISDRLPRLRMLLATDIAQALMITLISLLEAVGRLETWHIYIANLLTGIMVALAQPASMAMIPDVTSDENLSSANSLISLSTHLTGVIAPIFGAVLIQRLGFSAAFGLNAFAFFISAGFLAAMQPHLLVDRSDAVERIHLWEDFSGGWQFVAGRSWLWISMLVLLLVNFTGRSTMNVVLPFLVEAGLQSGVGTLGLLRSVFGVGSVLGAVWVGLNTKMSRKGWIFYGCLFVTGMLTAALGLPFPPAVLIAAMLLIGVCLAVNNLLWSVVLQERVPRPILGRVTSLSNVSSTALLPVGFALAGAVTDQIGASQVFVWGGMLTALLALVGLLIPATHRI